MIFKVLTVVMALVAFWFVPLSSYGAKVTIGWDANSEPDLKGYWIWWKLASDSDWTNNVDAGNVTNLLIPDLVNGATYCFAAKAYNTSDQYSAFSNYLYATMPPPPSPILDASYWSSPEVNIDYLGGKIIATVQSLPTDPKEIFWEKAGLTFTKGQIIKVSRKAYYSGADFSAPTSLYVEDPLNENWATLEKVAYIDGTYVDRTEILVAKNSCTDCTLKEVAGHRLGSYEWTNPVITIENPDIPVIPNIFLEQLKTSTTGGKYLASFRMELPTGSQGAVVRTATTRTVVEKSAWNIGELYSESYLPAGQTTFDVDVKAALYGGFYISVANLESGQESDRNITWYLPANIIGNADDAIPPLSFKAKVDLSDLNWIGANLNKTVPAANGQPATLLGRANNYQPNGLVINSYDRSFVSSQKTAGATMK